MSEYTHTLEVDRPVRDVYDQWTQMQDFPRFMDGVEEVEQTSDTRMHWHVSIAGVDREFDAVITEQVPDERLAWCSVHGPDQSGVVEFRPTSAQRTEVSLTLRFDPEGLTETVGDALGFVERRVKGDLERFKAFAESGQAPTGAWRSEVHGGRSQPDRARTAPDSSPGGPAAHGGGFGQP